MNKLSKHLSDIKPLTDWLPGCKRPLIIAGPCGAESEVQVRDCALQLSKKKIDIFRAGIWKPRTRPHAFEGPGSMGLKWLRQVKEEFDIPVTTEVATPRHVEEALKAGIDILWVGARSTANPFTVQELADALKGVDIPVMIKNPINPDLSLWIGAIERLHHAGICKMLAIHRGFSIYEKTQYRNIPTWQIPIELKLLFPNLPLLCDPSHIAGNRELIFDLSQKALDLDYDGLMIECHPDPDHALSDAQQQITPTQLGIILTDLKVRLPNSTNKDFVNHLEEIRQKIDKLDHEVLLSFKQRMKLVTNIGKYKRDHNVTILQGNRWEEILQNVLTEGKKLGLSNEFILDIYKAIHDESIRLQNWVMNTPLTSAVDSSSK